MTHLKTKNNMTKEIVQCVKHLSHKHEDINSGPGNTYKAGHGTMHLYSL